MIQRRGDENDCSKRQEIFSRLRGLERGVWQRVFESASGIHTYKVSPGGQQIVGSAGPECLEDKWKTRVGKLLRIVCSWLHRT